MPRVRKKEITVSREEFIENSNARIKELKRVINYTESLRSTGLKGLGSDDPIQSTGVSVQLSEMGPPNPPPQASGSLPTPRVMVGDTPFAGEGGGGHLSYDWTETLVLYIKYFPFRR